MKLMTLEYAVSICIEAVLNETGHQARLHRLVQARATIRLAIKNRDFELGDRLLRDQGLGNSRDHIVIELEALSNLYPEGYADGNRERRPFLGSARL